MKESTIERHLVKRVKALGGEVRKVQWIGRANAPDRLVLLPITFNEHGQLRNYGTWFVEVKNPDTIKTFPANAHERAQHREHIRMLRMGARVLVIGTIAEIEEFLK